MPYQVDSIPWSGRGRLFLASQNADETELEAIRLGIVSIDSGVADDVIADVHHADDKIGNGDWSNEDIALEDITGPLVEEIDRRAALLRDAYPFVRVGGSLKYRQSKSGVYEFCLVASLQKDISSTDWKDIPVLFEIICCLIFSKYIGGGLFNRTGWPSHDKNERPVRFRALINELNRKTGGEFVWSPQPPHTKDDDPSHNDIKDEGLDFVVWKPFKDARLGKLFILGQCACGGNWESKMEELSIARLGGWMSPITYSDFVRAFAIPFHIPGHFVFAYVSKLAGLTLDRVRMTEIAEEDPSVFSDDIRKKMDGLIKKKLAA